MTDGLILAELHKQLSERETALVESVIRSLPSEQYHQTCGRIDELRTIRDLIPQIIKTLRKE